MNATSDNRLFAVKYGRTMVPLITMILILSLVRLSLDQLVVQQVYGIGVMLIEVALTLYALDASLRLTGLCDDRLLLLSPLSRWQLAVRSTCVLSLYLLLGYIATLLPLLNSQSVNLTLQLANLLGYGVSVFTGLGLMLLITYAVKSIRERFQFILSTWVLFSVTTFLAVALCVRALNSAVPSANWLLGVSSAENTINLYAANLPVTAVGLAGHTSTVFLFILTNLVLGAVFWAGALALARRKHNFIRL